MKCSLDKVLLDARQLANKIRASDEAADELIRQASDAHNKMLSKKINQEEILTFEELNEVSKTRPRHRLMMCIAAENKQLELLKQENQILRTSLTEYETTFQMIIKKFKKHKILLKKLEEVERGNFNSCVSSQSVNDNQILLLCSKISQLKHEIECAMKSDTKITENLSEVEAKLSLENMELRKLLQISEEFKNELIASPIINSNRDCTNNHLNHKSNDNNHISLSKPAILNGISASNSKYVGKIFSKSLNNTQNNDLEEDDDDHSSVASDASVATIVN